MIDNNRLKRIFDQAVEIASSEERIQFVSKQCEGDESLRERLRQLLSAHDEAHSFLKTLSDSKNNKADGCALTVEEVDSLGLGIDIGRYRLKRQIGSGGFGLVFLAEQTTPVSRKVALKLIKPGMVSQNIVRRFEAERQALALMDHTGIAKILDAGTTETDQPYFVMELVAGLPITQYCDEKRMSTTRRLELFRDVCLAVHHAHQKGIIHRDLKPSNILVSETDDKHIPKVIDFGIAKAIQLESSADPTITLERQIVGTPLYMSPEQARCDRDIDTRSDIYSLGVLLYELLTGSTPILNQDSKGKELRQIVSMIQNESPPKPSRRLSLQGDSLEDIAFKRNSNPTRLKSVVKGDLDWIVSKAIEKDRAHRYSSAAALGQDIDRFLANDPIEARPPSVRYRLSRFYRKNRIALTFAAAFTFVLLSASAFSFWQAHRATRNAKLAMDAFNAEKDAKAEATRLLGIAKSAENRAVVALRAEEERRREFQAMWNFTMDVFQDPDPTRAMGSRDVTVVELLDRQRGTLADKFDENPETRATMMFVLGKTYLGLGQISKAESLLNQAIQLREKLYGKDHPSTLTILYDQVDIDIQKGEYESAITKAESILVKEKLLTSNEERVVRAKRLLGHTLLHTREFDKAIDVLEDALNQSQASFGIASNQTLRLMISLGLAYDAASQEKKASDLFAKALARMSKSDPKSRYEMLSYSNDIAFFQSYLGNPRAAVSTYDSILPIAKGHLGEGHPVYLSYLFNSAQARFDASMFHESVEQLEEAWKLNLRYAQGDRVRGRRIRFALADAMTHLGRITQASKILREEHEFAETHLGKDDVRTLEVRFLQANILVAQGNYEDAIDHYEATLKTAEAALGHDHRLVTKCLSGLANQYELTNQFEKAICLFEKVVGVLKRNHGPDHVKTLHAKSALGRVYCSNGEIEKGIGLLIQTHQAQKESLGNDHSQTAETAYALALGFGHSDVLKATPYFEEVVRIRRMRFGDAHDETLQAINGLARNYSATGKKREAIELFKEAASICEQQFGVSDFRTHICLNDLAKCQIKLGDHEDSIQTLRKLLIAKRSSTNSSPSSLLTILHHLSESMFMTNRKEEGLKLVDEKLELAKRLYNEDPAQLGTIIAQAGFNLTKYGYFKEAERYAQKSCDLRLSAIPDSWQACDGRCFLYWIKSMRILAGQDAKQQSGRLEAIEEMWLAEFNTLRSKSNELPAAFREQILNIHRNRIVEFYELTGDFVKAKDLKNKPIFNK